MGDFIVTGARRGIGREVALALAAQGNTVWALSRTALDPAEWNFPQIHVRAVDPVRPDHWRLFAEELRAQGRTVSGLVNSAGYLVRKPLEELSPEDFADSFAANATAPAMAVQALMPLFEASVHVVTTGQLNTYDVLVADDVVFTQEAFDSFTSGPAKGRSAKAVATESEAGA